MKPQILIHPWKIIQDQWDPLQQRMAESLFAIGNGRMGQRANHEEDYSGETLQGSYIAGLYYPDKTKVGWWKNGYPDYFAKVLNSSNFIGIHVRIDGELLDLATATVVSEFRRELDMQHGLLTRTFTATLSNGVQVEVIATRLLSIVADDMAAIAYQLRTNQDAQVEIEPYIDANVINEDANWESTFWEPLSQRTGKEHAVVQSKTKRLNFHLAVAMQCQLSCDAEGQSGDKAGCPSWTYTYQSTANKAVILHKYVAVLSSLNAPIDDLSQLASTQAIAAAKQGFDAIKKAHQATWLSKWTTADIVIDGDDSAQQAIRFNIFHLLQTFTGVDPRLNIGPKGFTGEKYGGSTYWDTEAYCLPFYLASSDISVAKNLLNYRFNHLPQAIANAEKLGFKKGAALYPMVTMNGEECHNEWEITFEEVHRNGAIAYAIYNYIRHSQDWHHLTEGGLDVLTGIARFWAQRVNWSKTKKAYVMLGVTGPNEYENNVNNNYYTNFMAQWSLNYAAECWSWVESHEPDAYDRLRKALLCDGDELTAWKSVASKMYFPYDETLGIYLQQDGFLDKVIEPASALDPKDRPINQNWSWDRILRSCYIKQADTLQGMFFFEDKTSLDSLKKHFDYYEPLTVHESSLSPCVHTVLACRLNYREQALSLYGKTARLDLDDSNNEVHEGLHVTAMGGTWMSLVYGFGGMKILNDGLQFDPQLPEGWTRLTFPLNWRGALLTVSIDQNGVSINNQKGNRIACHVHGQAFDLAAGQSIHQQHPAS